MNYWPWCTFCMCCNRTPSTTPKKHLLLTDHTALIGDKIKLMQVQVKLSLLIQEQEVKHNTKKKNRERKEAYNITAPWTAATLLGYRQNTLGKLLEGQLINVQYSTFNFTNYFCLGSYQWALICFRTWTFGRYSPAP